MTWLSQLTEVAMNCAMDEVDVLEVRQAPLARTCSSKFKFQAGSVPTKLNSKSQCL
jgi:hypothetical protein